MRRSKIADRLLANPEFIALAKVHTALELANFSHGSGKLLPFVAIRMDWDRSGDSKKTVGWYETLADAKRDVSAMMDADRRENPTDGGADYIRQNRVAYYIREIANGKIYRV